MLIQRLNHMTGEAEWVQAEGHDDDAACSELVASSSYLDMLTDDRRNRAYRLALQAVLRPGSTVLDIGTGTGLLAMMAAQILSTTGPGPLEPSEAAAAGLGRYPPPSPASSPGHDGPRRGQRPPVTACELFPPMARMAQRAVQHNGLGHLVSVVPKRSDELTMAAGGRPTSPACPSQRQPCPSHHSRPPPPAADASATLSTPASPSVTQALLIPACLHLPSRSSDSGLPVPALQGKRSPLQTGGPEAPEGKRARQAGGGWSGSEAAAEIEAGTGAHPAASGGEANVGSCSAAAPVAAGAGAGAGPREGAAAVADQPSAASRRRAALAAAATAGSGSQGGSGSPDPDLPDGRVDVIVTEIFDSQLLGEGLLPTLWDAVPRLLKVEEAMGGRRGGGAAADAVGRGSEAAQGGGGWGG